MKTIAATILVFAVACGGGDDVPAPEDQSPPVATEGGEAEITVTSPSFAEGDTVPVEFTCDGSNVSPPLEWDGVPEGAAELHLLLEDPDAPGGTFTHWNVTGISPGAEAVSQGAVPEGGTEQPNDLGDGPYGGPCPPPGDEPHRYMFTVRALGEDGEVLAEGTLTARYGR